MNTFRRTLAAGLLVVVLAWFAGIIGFRYPKFEKYEPLDRPVEVIGVLDDWLLLSDLRVIQIRGSSAARLRELITESPNRIEVQGTGPIVTL
ncbi:MAG: hypothetical protein AAFX06_15530 [Planctomycetota bacterium]